MPKRYIRTFAGDIDTVKKGGAPNLVPFQDGPRLPEVPAAVPVAPELAPLSPAPAAVPTPPPAAPVPHPAVLHPLQKQPVPSAPSPVVLPEAPQPRPPTVSLPPAPVPAAVENELGNAMLFPGIDVAPQKPNIALAGTLKTYEGDFAERMKTANASLTTVLAAEQDAPAAQPEAATESKTSLVLVVAGVVLILVGIVGGAIAYLRYASVSAPVTFTPVAEPPIFVDEREQVSGEGTPLLTAIQASVQKPLAPGSVRFLYLDNQNSSVFAALRLFAPDILGRNIQAEGSMVGVVNAGLAAKDSARSKQSPFFILSVGSYSSSFSGMLSWEPLIRHDLDALFPAYINATTSMPIALQATFVDGTVANHDVRIFRDGTGESALLYGYWDQKTLIIARDAPAFVEILRRLAVAQSSK